MAFSLFGKGRQRETRNWDGNSRKGPGIKSFAHALNFTWIPGKIVVYVSILTYCATLHFRGYWRGVLALSLKLSPSPWGFQACL